MIENVLLVLLGVGIGIILGLFLAIPLARIAWKRAQIEFKNKKR